VTSGLRNTQRSHKTLRSTDKEEEGNSTESPRSPTNQTRYTMGGKTEANDEKEREGSTWGKILCQRLDLGSIVCL
jgi:hypothetical protein